MKERPILFSAPMVRALLAGTKTQTRRALRVQPPASTTSIGTFHHPYDDRKGKHFWSWGPDPMHPGRDYIQPDWAYPCPYGQAGDRLWVRETWAGPLISNKHWEEFNHPSEIEKPEFCQYAADGGPAPEFMDADDNLRQRWTPSIHMPRWASRITLEVTGVRVERLQDISEADAKAEGCQHNGACDHARRSCEEIGCMGADSYRGGYADLWEQINGPGSWAANPWVWAVDFKRIA